MYERINSLIGNENLDKIKNKTVLIIGLGGVGSYALESLVRSGVNNIIIVDYDKIDITNFNRKLEANYNTIDNYKTQVYNDRIFNINKDVKIIGVCEKITLENYLDLFNYNFDYLIDACDDIKIKQVLIKTCLEKNIKFISCMGTARKLDPTKLSITTLDKTSYDKIAKILRSYVIKEKIKGKIMVVSSTEEVINCETTSLGSMIFVPASAGILCAKYVIDDIINQ